VCGYQKIVVSLEWFSSSLQHPLMKFKDFGATSLKNPTVGTSLCKLKLGFRCTRQLVPGNQEGHQNPTQFYHVVWIIFTRLHRLYNLQAAKSEHRQKARRRWWFIQTTKRNPTKPTKLCNNMCSPSSSTLVYNCIK
jgi:hypothetical protein